MRKGDQARVLRTEAQGLAVLLAVVKQVALIAFDHGPGHFDRSFEAALLAPLDEEAEMKLASVHRLLGVVPHSHGLQMLTHHDLQRLSCGRFGFALLRDPRHLLHPGESCAVGFSGDDGRYDYDRILLLLPGSVFLAIFVKIAFRPRRCWRFPTRTTPGHPPNLGRT